MLGAAPPGRERAGLGCEGHCHLPWDYVAAKTVLRSPKVTNRSLKGGRGAGAPVHLLPRLSPVPAARLNPALRPRRLRDASPSPGQRSTEPASAARAQPRRSQILPEQDEVERETKLFSRVSSVQSFGKCRVFFYGS